MTSPRSVLPNKTKQRQMPSLLELCLTITHNGASLYPRTCCAKTTQTCWTNWEKRLTCSASSKSNTGANRGQAQAFSPSRHHQHLQGVWLGAAHMSWAAIRKVARGLLQAWSSGPSLVQANLSCNYACMWLWAMTLHIYWSGAIAFSMYKVICVFRKDT